MMVCIQLPFLDAIYQAMLLFMCYILYMSCFKNQGSASEYNNIIIYTLRCPN